MPMTDVGSEMTLRLEFFDYLFSDDIGYVCICTQRPNKRETFNEHYFKWPTEKVKLLKFIDNAREGHNVWFGINVLSTPKRLKQNCIPQNLVWADLDTCTPDKLDIPPQCVIESSPGRFQAIWRLDKKLDPERAEDYSKRIAYKYADLGADKTGHDLTQLLRVPGTINYKYDGLQSIPEVKLITSFAALLNPSVFEAIEVVYEIETDNGSGPEVPSLDGLPNPEFVIYEYRTKLQATSFPRLYGEEPGDDWSSDLWALINICVESGMNTEEVFAVALNSKCNKYKRDGRPVSHLWKDVLKADVQQKQLLTVFEKTAPLQMPQLLTAKESNKVGNSIIHDYLTWASQATDAVEEYHEISCAMLLSALMASGLHVKVEWGKIIPNLWGLILGDTTLTRKTTAMDMAMDFLIEIDPEIIVASDGSPEGILTAVSRRPKMTSVFYRDEVAGLFEMMHKRDYLAGIHETFTKMYDVPKHWPKQLKRETIILQEPVFIFFGGGILEKSYSMISEQFVTSGFIPRFLVVTGYADLDKVRPTGPPRNQNVDKRNELKALFNHLHNTYSEGIVEVELEVGTMEIEREIEAQLTNDAWAKFVEVEQKLIHTAYDSPDRHLAAPTFQRMAFSMLKLATLFAAARQEPTDDGKITVELTDIIEATFFIQKWGKHMVDLLKHAGRSTDEVRLNAVYRTVERIPGILRGEIMARHHLSAPVMDIIQRTLEDRMMVRSEKKGRGYKYWPIGR